MDGPFHAKNVQVRSEWWVLWRRIAGGLSASQQRQLFLKISSLIKPGKGGKKPNLAPQEEMELWMTLANLERLSQDDKAARGKQLLKSLHPKKSRPQHWWSLARIGAREPLYGPIDRVLSAGLVTSWIKTILSQDWKKPQPVGMALAQLARLTGDRKRDLAPEVIQEIIDWLSLHEWATPHIRILKEVVPLGATRGNPDIRRISTIGHSSEGGIKFQKHCFHNHLFMQMKVVQNFPGPSPITTPAISLSTVPEDNARGRNRRQIHGRPHILLLMIYSIIG